MNIAVAYSPMAGQVLQVQLQLPLGATVGDAIEGSGLLANCSELSIDSLLVGVWGRVCEISDVLRDKDRVEIYRPLKVDPKEARRLRARSQTPKQTPKPTPQQTPKKKPGR